MPKVRRLDKKTPKGSGHKPDYLLVGTFATILLFGLIILTSAGSALGYEKFNDSYYFIRHQILFGLIPGIILLLFFSKLHYEKLKKIANPLLFLSIILLIIVFIPGIGAQYGTAHSWINLGGFSFQPSELVKLTFLLYLANWLSKRGETGVRDFYYGLLPFVFLIGIISVLMLLQPDMGTLSIIIFMCLAVFFASGARFKHVIGLIGAGFLSIFLLIKSAPYRAARLTTFLQPELDPLGIGYHINQAFLAIGSGGIFGRGFGHSRQKFSYLPEVTGDSIFAIMAEELGFIFAFFLIALFAFLMYRGFQVAEKTSDSFGKLVATGIISWFSFQAFFNICSMVGLMPITGVPLPFVSSGGTSLAIAMAAMGILINISKHTKQN
ncbi:putative lipid II flippase FtsW [Candidatus Falkowbacteria bacterium CG10_big_fil_rev_8_21_14_0_10_39_11]|uniref:Probable peptidoglycan glycosyltransferase FtsW n=1 Tax=Candidatus Falkowbacteria bacterium CG10_big_fil_rev_8_21_14_0_10_39_11 TaxID=1974565 RepID=A0A2H0V5C0_9BACT|nr:MAG: putative lipid II flippase FtsW [Candidatus Falkowbacteria bacterium CG10_big_fil_rev_8_21_14_0_10_39_11]